MRLRPDWTAALTIGSLAVGVLLLSAFAFAESRVSHPLLPLRPFCAVDCGVAVAPDQIRAQMEGGVCYGLSSALYGKITLKDGIVEQKNFDSYRVLRMNEAPHVETFIVPSGAHPSGCGEPGTPVIIPAVANALLAASGQATTSLPFVKT